jgi:hypothetical protein
MGGMREKIHQVNNYVREAANILRPPVFLAGVVIALAWLLEGVCSVDVPRFAATNATAIAGALALLTGK